MKLVGNTVQRTFLVNYKGKEYFIDYLNSDYQNLSLINRDNWEITDEDGEEVNTYFFKSFTKKEKAKTELNIKIYNKLISFCIKNFNSYRPKL